MRVIDLLNKIANGEEVPKKIKYEEDIYIYDDEAREGKAYHTMIGEGRICYLFEMVYYLNEEVEIIEEDKKIEKLTHLNNVSNASDLVTISQMQWENNSIIERKINEIIDKLNKE